MFDRLDIFKMSASMASHAGRRQALAAQNMANVDTPGYRAQRLPSFSEVAESPRENFSPRATRQGHLNSPNAMAPDVQVRENRDDPSPDGNTVTVEGELLESVGAKREHDRALAVYKSALKILHTTLSRN